MNICHLCEKELENTNSENIEVKLEDGKFICQPCHNVTLLFNSEPVKSRVKIEKKLEPKIEIKSISICVFCKSEYDDNKCLKCNKINPLLQRKKKKKKKKK